MVKGNGRKQKRDGENRWKDAKIGMDLVVGRIGNG